MSLFEVSNAASAIYEAAGDQANVIFGAVIDDSLSDEMRVTVIATGFNASTSKTKSINHNENIESGVNINDRNIEHPEYHSTALNSAEKHQPIATGAVNGQPNGNSHRIKSNGNGERIHIGAFDMTGEPPEDKNLPTFLRRNKN
jgi:hypothetical protein